MEIEITSKSLGTHILSFDDADAERVLGHSWHINKCCNKLYAASRINHKIVRLHTFLLGAGPGHIDHIDGDSMNNHRSNLRRCTHSQNLQNMGIGRRNKTGFKGVWFSNEEGKYKSQITTNGKRRCIGTFATAIEAARKYNEVAFAERGEFAKLNIIPNEQ